MHRDAGEWRHSEGSISPSVLSKEGQQGRRCLFILDVGVVKFWGAKNFARISPNLPEKCFVKLLPTNFLPQGYEHLFFGNLKKEVFMCFYVNLGRHFLKTNNVGRHSYPDFQGFCKNFQQIKTFGGALAIAASPPPTLLLFTAVSG